MRHFIISIILSLSLFGCSPSESAPEPYYVDLSIYLPHPNHYGHFYVPVESDRPTHFHCSDIWIYDYEVHGSQSIKNTIFNCVDELAPDYSFSITNSAQGVDDFSFCIHSFSAYYDHNTNQYGHSSNAKLEKLWLFSIDSWYDYPSQEFLNSFTFDIYSPMVYKWLESSPFDYYNFLHHVFNNQLEPYSIFSSTHEPFFIPEGLISSMNSLVYSMKTQFPEAPLGTLGYAVLDALSYYWLSN